MQARLGNRGYNNPHVAGGYNAKCLRRCYLYFWCVLAWPPAKSKSQNVYLNVYSLPKSIPLFTLYIALLTSVSFFIINSLPHKSSESQLFLFDWNCMMKMGRANSMGNNPSHPECFATGGFSLVQLGINNPSVCHSERSEESLADDLLQARDSSLRSEWQVKNCWETSAEVYY